MAVQANINKGCLHAGQDLRDLTFVNVSQNAFVLTSLDQQCGYLVVPQDGKPGLQTCRAYNELFVHQSSFAWKKEKRDT